MARKYARRLGVRLSKRKRANAKSRRRVVFSTSRARTRRFRYRRKAKTSTGRLWKYVKKATRSEVKRFDGFCPANPSYCIEKGGTLTSDLGGIKMSAQGRYLVIACASFYHDSATNPAYTINSSGQLSELYGPLLLKNQGWRMDRFSGFGLKTGSVAYEVVGNEIFLKYYSMKMMLHVQVPNSWTNENYQHQKFELWWIEEKITDGVSSLQASEMARELWDCTTQFFRAQSGTTRVTGDFEVDGSKPTIKQLQRFNFAFRRKRLDLNARNVKMRKLYSISITDIINKQLSYTGEWNNGSGVLHSSNTNLASFTPTVITKTFIIPVNRKLKIRDEPTDQRFLNYAYYLFPLDSTLTNTNTAADEVFRAYFTCEGVFTDK